MKLKIESTETGEVFNMRLESSIDKLKFQVSLLIPIPPQDQIMLIGPPYKILDSLYGPTMDIEGKRIFVFNRRILSDSSKEPQRIRLLPYEVSKPELTYDPQLDHALGSPRGDDNDSTHVKIREFEQYFQTQLKKSQCLEMYIQESYKSCKTCVAQHQVQLDGIGAAISNLQYFHRSIHKSYVALEGKLLDQQAHHASLLENFESGLQALGEVSLHPAIRAAIEDYSMSASTAVSGMQTAVGVAAAGVSNVATPGATVPVSTLLDCVPVERERVYLTQCWANHRKVDENLRRVRGLHQEVQAGVQELQLPSVDFSSLQHDLDSINQESAAAAELMRRFRRDYHFVYEHITHSASPSRQSQVDAAAAVAAGEAFTSSAGEQSESTAIGAEGDDASSLSARRDGSGATGIGGPIDSVFDDRTGAGGNIAESLMSTATTVSPRDSTERVLGELQRRKNAQEGAHYFEMLESCAKRVREAKAGVERSQNWLLGAIYRTMRQIAMLQTDIQYKLKQDVGWMKKLTQGHNEYFVHLEKIEKLPVIYHHLLNEIARRRSYNDLFEAEVIAASESISAFRSEETRQRELFMQKYGLHLPPIFFKAIPTLKDKPPYFSPTLTDPQWLPEVGYDDVNRDYITGEFSIGDAAQISLKSAAGGISVAGEGDGDTVSSAGADRSAVSTRIPAGRGGDNDSGTISATPISDSRLTAMLNRYGSRNASSEMSEVSEARSQGQSQRNSTTMSGGRPNVADSQYAPDSAEDMAGSVILRAVPRDSDDTGYQKLARQCSKLEYENAQYASIIADLRAQLASNNSSSNNEKQQDVAAAPETASVTASTEISKVPAAAEATPSTSAATDTVVGTAGDTTVPRTDQGPSTPQPAVPSASPMKSPAEEELQGKLNRVGTLNQLMHGYAQLRDLIKADTATQAYIAELESHALLPPLPDDQVLYSGSETYIEPPSGAIVSVRDTAQTVLSGVHALLNALSQQLRQPRISFTAFRAGDIALFMPVATDNRKIWMAFHANTPYRYLAEDSLLSFQQRSKNREQRPHIIGRIFLIDRKESTLEENPYNLALGTEYFVCYVEPLRTGAGTKKSTAVTGVKASAGEKMAGAKAAVVKDAATTATTSTSAAVTTDAEEGSRELDQLTAKIQG